MSSMDGTEGMGLQQAMTAQQSLGYRVATITAVVWGVTASIILAWIQGPTLDEPAHLAAGVYTWRTGQYDVYRVNSPLPRQVATLPLLIAIDDIVFEKQDPDYELLRPEFRMGRQLMRETGVAKFRKLLFIARLPTVCVSLLTSFLVYHWSKRLVGVPIAIGTLWLWWTSPLILTNSATVSADIWGALGGIVAIGTLCRWIGKRDVGNTVKMGLGLALAMLCRTSWIVLVPLELIVILVIAIRRKRPQALGQGLVAIGTALLVVNAAYRFHGTGISLGEYTFLSEFGTGSDRAAGNRFFGGFLGDVPVPLPWAYVSGLDLQLYDFSTERISFLNGQWQTKGWWYYYPVAFLLKEPLGHVGLFAWLAVSLTFSFIKCLMDLLRRPSDRFFRPVASDSFYILLAVLATMGYAVCSQVGFSRYLRYVIPMYPLAIVLGCYQLFSSSPKTGGSMKPRYSIAIVCLLISTFAVVARFPGMHGFFNIAAGGPDAGHNYLLSANVDWGEDTWILKEWIKKQEYTTPPVLRAPNIAWVGLLEGSVKTLSDEELADGIPAGVYIVSKEAVLVPHSPFHWVLDRSDRVNVAHAYWVVEVHDEQSEKVSGSAGMKPVFD